MLRLDGKTAVVTGGASGIGRAICQVFARQGATVEILDLDDEAAAETIESGGRDGLSGLNYRRCDVSNHAVVGDVIESIHKAHDSLDILINNAGVAHVGSVATATEEDFDRVMAVNLKGVYNCSHFAAPIMAEQGAGVILNIASTVAWFGLGERFAYAASKGAVVAMTYSIAKDFVSNGVRCNAILPGRIHTPFVDGFVAKNYPGQEEEMMQKLSDFQPIGRMGKPEEIANAALFLCSDEASFVTGSVHPIDGGTITLR